MRKKFILTVLLIAIAMLGFILWPRQHKEADKTKLLQEPASKTSTNRKTVYDKNVSNSVTQAASSLNLQAKVENDKDRLPEIFKVYNETHNKPIEFYGLIVDQDGDPISDANVSIAISQTYMESQNSFALIPKTLHFNRKTGANGRFGINNEKGDGVSIESISKSGYELEPAQIGYGTSAGSFQNPVIFTMWSTNIHEQLVTGGGKYQIVPDGRPYFIDLTKGTISESGEGDLRVWIQYTNQVVPGQLYDWSCGIEVMNGGLQQDDSYSMFRAPSDGYVPKFSLQQQIKGGQRGSIGERHFYLKLKNGQEYGCMTIELHAPFNNQISGLINLSYVVNPSGSHILR